MRCPRRSCAGAATGVPRSASASHCSFARRASPPIWTTCSTTPSSTRSCSPPRCRACRARHPGARGGQALLRREAPGPVRGRRRAGRRGPAALGEGADGRPPAAVPPRRQQRSRRSRTPAISATSATSTAAAEPGQAAHRRERALEPGRPRRLGPAAPRARGALRDVRPRRVLHARGNRGRRLRLPALPLGLAAHLHLSWLDPHKERRFTIVGSKRMATFDDMDPDRKITVYDKGFDQSAEPYEDFVARSGDIWSPPVPAAEPLGGVRALRGLRPRGARADLRRAQRPRGRPRARGAADLARRQPPGRASDGDDRRARCRENLLRLFAVSTGLIGMARCVRATSSVAGQVERRRYVAHRRLAVDGHAVVGLVADAAASASAAARASAARCARRRGARRASAPAAATGRRRARRARRPRSGAPAARRPSAQPSRCGQLHAQDRGLQLVQARVVADVLVGDLVLRAVEAQHPHAVGQRVVVGRDRAAVAEAAEVLRREEAERRRPSPARRAARPPRSCRRPGRRPRAPARRAPRSPPSAPRCRTGGPR